MKRLMLLAVGVCLLASLGHVVADQKEDEAAINKVIKAIFDTWNANDGEAMAALFEDGWLNFAGQQRRADQAQSVKKNHADFKNAKATLIKDIGVVFLKPDVAIQRRITEYSASSGPAGMPTLVWNRTASVLMKKNGEWLVVAQFAAPMTEEQIKEMKQTQ